MEITKKKKSVFSVFKEKKNVFCVFLSYLRKHKNAWKHHLLRNRIALPKTSFFFVGNDITTISQVFLSFLRRKCLKSTLHGETEQHS